MRPLHTDHLFRRLGALAFAVMLLTVAMITSSNAGPLSFEPAPAAESQLTYDSEVKETTQVTTRFGDRLTVELTFPAVDGEKAPGRFPVVACLCYITNVNSGTDLSAPLDVLATGRSVYAQHGYVAATVRVAGSGTSEGKQWNQADEKWQLMNYDAIEWLGTQEWSTGKVGTIGGSGNGQSQWFTSQRRPPHLTTMIPGVSGHDSWDTLSPGGMRSLQIGAFACGIPGLGTTALNGLPVPAVNSATLDLSPEQLKYLLEMNVKKYTSGHFIPFCPITDGAWEHPEKDEFWTGDMLSKVQDVDIPVMAWGGWDDIFDYATAHSYLELGSDQKKMVMGMSSHGSPDNGDGYNRQTEALRWFDHFLKGVDNGVDEDIKNGGFEYYVDREFVWKRAPKFPIPGTDYTDFRLGDGGSHPLADGSLSVEPSADAGKDTYTYVPLLSLSGLMEMTYDLANPFNPNNPAKDSFLNQNLTNGDQRLFTGPDTVTYVSEPLTEDLEVTGPIDATIFASSTAADTDFVFKLVDGFPDDKSLGKGIQPGFFELVTSGNLKGTFRTYKDKFVKQTPIPTGEVVQYEIEGKPLSHMFKAGHRIVMIISSSAAPRLMPNLNPAKVTIHHSPEHPSRITLPIIGPDAQSVLLRPALSDAASTGAESPSLISDIQDLLQKAED